MRGGERMLHLHLEGPANPRCYDGRVAEPPGSTLSLPATPGDRSNELRREPVLVLALECGRTHAGAVRYRLADLTAVALGRGPDRTHRRVGTELSIQVPDKWMSSRHARIEARLGRWDFVDESKNGSIVDGMATKRTVLEDGSVIELGRSLFVFFEGIQLAGRAPVAHEVIPRAGALLESMEPAWQAELARLDVLAHAEMPAMLEGEGGSGKRELARAIHDQSGRTGAWVYVNCGELVDAEAEQALLGTTDAPGPLRAAAGGTLLLDDVGALPAAAQAVVMRVLQERSIQIPKDLVRILSTTDRDLNALVAAGQFRGDLLAALGGLRLSVPTLAARRIDLGLLIATLHLRLFGADHPGFEAEAVRLLLLYPWPLNVWELEHALTSARVLAGEAAVRAEHLPEPIRTRRPPGAPVVALLDDADRQLHDRVRAALREHRGNVSRVARALDKDRRQIQRWMQRFGFDADRFR